MIVKLVSLIKRRMRVFENRVERRIFSLKRDEVMGGWRALHNEELNDLYPSPSVIRFKEDEMEGTSIGEKRNLYRLLAI
jgi:hypothetical protein